MSGQWPYTYLIFFIPVFSPHIPRPASGIMQKSCKRTHQSSRACQSLGVAKVENYESKAFDANMENKVDG